jgi:hypothetical protein
MSESDIQERPSNQGPDRDGGVGAETQSDSNKCPECDEPIDNLRAACPNCGYEYTDDDYDDKDAGSEFRAGSEVDEEELGEKVKEAEMESRSSAEEGGAGD